MRKVLYTIAGLLVSIVVVVGGYVLSATFGLLGNHWGPGVIEGQALPKTIVSQRTTVQRRAARSLGVSAPRQILFGDLHVHTTFSTDAFFLSLPILGGRGASPVADACDFARYCSSLDFWSVTDHAEASSPQRWRETKESIRQCNAMAGDDRDPDVTAFLGFEWTQVGPTPEDHYGHKNVIFKEQDDDAVAARAIASAGLSGTTLRSGTGGLLPPIIPFLDFDNRQIYYDFVTFAQEAASVPACDAGVPSKDLPADCYEEAATPADLVARLESQGVENIIIPHGTTWGFYTPPGSGWDRQLKAEMRPEAQTLIEIMSGHGNSDRYKPFLASALSDASGAGQGYENYVCPEPTGDYLPSCWQAGEIIRGRCMDEGLGEEECDSRAVQARQNYVYAGVGGHLTVPGAVAEDWLDSGQCRDCFVPSFNYRPKGSAQYGLAVANFDDPSSPQRFRWGFIAASDNHYARPGTGYKEYDRFYNTEAAGGVTQQWADRLRGAAKEPVAESAALSLDGLGELGGFQRLEFERQASFFVTGGLAAVHSEGRTRDEIWAAMKRREVYGTSGPRIMLWFDLVQGGGASDAPMGSEVDVRKVPSFRVRAAGSLKQKPGCPDFASAGLPAERLETLCSGECYNPSGERHKITRIEVIRITPQNDPGEDVANLIEDPWKVIPCTGRGGCTVEFKDNAFMKDGRHRLYYVRAIQEPMQTVNGANLRCEYDEEGICVKVNPCHGDYRTPASENCLSPVEHRAWSSPIYVNHPRNTRGG
ncbi:MAG: DUF3604 domain-containing protein [Parvularculales bacterium]